MDIDARIARRRRRTGEQPLVEDFDPLSPVSHVDEPSGRGPVLERLLDHLDPVFDGRLPPNAYVSGPPGAGKSAVVTALVRHLDALSPETRPAIHTSTRVASPSWPDFVAVDLRETTSEFAFHHAVLDAVTDDHVPRHGLGTADVRTRLRERLDDAETGVVLAVDHVLEPDGPGGDELVDRLAALPSNVSWLAVGRRLPDDVPLTAFTGTEVRIDPYRRETLVDVLASRASMGLARRALDHEYARRIAEWARGDAHDALTALFVAADRATRAERTRLVEEDVAAAMEDVPRDGVSLARVLALPDNRRRVLRELVDLDPDVRTSVTATTEAIASRDAIDLSPGTVKRYLYEMAEAGVVERVRSEVTNEQGRPPSRVELRFSPTAFQRLDELQG